jgi:hypothetical protein
LVIAESVTKIISSVAISLVKKFVAKLRGKPDESWKDEYDVSEDIVWLLYL